MHLVRVKFWTAWPEMCEGKEVASVILSNIKGDTWENKRPSLLLASSIRMYKLKILGITNLVKSTLLSLYRHHHSDCVNHGIPSSIC